MDVHNEPLLELPQHPEREARGTKAEADATIGFFFFQVTVMVSYTILAFLMPKTVPAMAEAAHIATMHVFVFILVAFFLALSARHVYGPEARRLPPFFPISPLLAQQGLFLTTLTNAALLLIVGVESWLRRELGNSFSVLSLVQSLAVAEGLAALTGAAVASYRLVQYAKVSTLAGDDDGGEGGGGGRWSVADEGRQQRSRTQSFRIGDATARAGAIQQQPSAAAQAAAASQQQLADALEQIRALRAREEQLGARVAELSAALASQLEAGGESVSAAALRLANEHVLELQAEQRRLAGRVAEGEERRAYYEAELQRAANDVARYRESLKLEMRRNEKLLHSLEVEKEANLHVQGDLADLRQLLEAGSGGRGARAVEAEEESAHAAAYAAARPAAPPLTSPAPRTASMAIPPRVSFGGPLDGGGPGAGRPVASINSPTPYGSPGAAAGAGSSRRLLALTSRGGGGAAPPAAAGTPRLSIHEPSFAPGSGGGRTSSVSELLGSPAPLLLPPPQQAGFTPRRPEAARPPPQAAVAPAPSPGADSEAV